MVDVMRTVMNYDIYGVEIDGKGMMVPDGKFKNREVAICCSTADKSTSLPDAAKSLPSWAN